MCHGENGVCIDETKDCVCLIERFSFYLVIVPFEDSCSIALFCYLDLQVKLTLSLFN